MKLLIIALMLGGVGCATKQQFLQTSAISMTKTHLSGKVKQMDTVEEKFCRGDASQLNSENDIVVGLVDEVVYKAQKANDADLIKDATFYYFENCVIMEGRMAKLVR